MDGWLTLSLKITSRHCFYTNYTTKEARNKITKWYSYSAEAVVIFALSTSKWKRMDG